MKYKVLSYNKDRTGVRVDYINTRSEDEAYIAMKELYPSRHIFNITCIDSL